MNFLSWPYRSEYYYKHYRISIIIACIIFIILLLLLWSIGIFLYRENKSVDNESYRLQHLSYSNHLAVQKYEKIIQNRMGKKIDHSIAESILLHLVDNANSQIVLNSIVFGDDGFIVTGICTNAEAVMSYSQRIKGKLKGVTINAKQGIDTNRKIHTFQLSGKYEKIKSKP